MNRKQKKKRPAGSRKAASPVPGEWLYLAPEGVSLRFLYDHLKKERRWKTEYWEEAKVLEIGILEAGSVDLEYAEAEDEALQAYRKAQGAAVVYEVTIMPEHFAEAKAVMEHVAEYAGGVFCADTDDFMPEIRKDS